MAVPGGWTPQVPVVSHDLSGRTGIVSLRSFSLAWSNLPNCDHLRQINYGWLKQKLTKSMNLELFDPGWLKPWFWIITPICEEKSSCRLYLMVMEWPEIDLNSSLINHICSQVEAFLQWRFFMDWNESGLRGRPAFAHAVSATKLGSWLMTREVSFCSGHFGDCCQVASLPVLDNDGKTWQSFAVIQGDLPYATVITQWLHLNELHLLLVAANKVHFLLHVGIGSFAGLGRHPTISRSTYYPEGWRPSDSTCFVTASLKFFAQAIVIALSSCRCKLCLVFTLSLTLYENQLCPSGAFNKNVDFFLKMTVVMKPTYTVFAFALCC